MSYIIVFRNTHREPFIHTDSHYFKEVFYTYEQAKEAAAEIIEQQGSEDPHYFDFQVYQEVDS